MTRSKIRSRLLIIGVALAVLYGVAQLAMHEISTGMLSSLIEKNLTHALGLEVSLDELMVALLPTPHLQAKGVRVANFPGRPAPHLLSIDRLELGIAVWPLLKRTVVVDELTLKGAELHLETNAEGRLGGGLKLDAMVDDGDKDAVQLELRQLHVETLRAFYRDGRDGASRSLVVDSIEVASKDLDSEISLEAQGAFEGSGIALSGQTGSLREILKPTGPFPIDLHGQLFEANVEAKGTVRELWALEGIELEIAAEIPKLVIEDQSLPELGTIRFSAHLSYLGGSLGLERLSLKSTQTEPVRIELRGKIDDLLELKGVDVEADLQTGSLDFLNPLIQPHVDFPFPAIASLSAKTKLSHQKGGLTLDGSMRATTPGGAIVMNAEGAVRDLTGMAKLDVKLDAQAHDLTSLSTLIPGFPKHGPLGPVTASGRLKSHRGALGASGIEVRLGSREKAWVELDGSVADVVALRGVELELAFGAESLHHLKELLERELPQTSALVGSSAISDKDGSLGVKHLRLHGGEDSPVEIHLEAKFDDLPRRDEIEIELGLRGQDTRVLGALVGVDVPVISPVEFHGQVKGSLEKLEAEGMTLRLAETRLLGTLSGSFAPHARPAVKARITSKNVRLQDLGLVRSETASVSANSGATRSIGGSAKLPFEDLRQVDLDVGLRFDRLGGYQGLDASDVRFTLRLQDGHLVVTDTGALYQDGQLDVDLHVDATTPLPKLKIALQTQHIDITRVMSQFQEQTEYSGIVDANLDLTATGDTLDALRQSLAGRVDVSTRDGNIASRIGRQFVVNLVDVAFPHLRSKKLPSIGCGIIELEIEQGIASVQTLFLKEKEISVSGKGRIDLVRGLYDLRVVPKTSNPGILSFVPEVSVRGPLDDPTFHPKKRTLMTSLGSGLLKNAFKAAGSVVLPFRKRATAKGVTEADCRATVSVSSRVFRGAPLLSAR